MRVPITLGHEAAGRVIAIGPEVTAFRFGDRVATMHRDACGKCKSCRRGDTTLCEAAAWVLGILADGGYARHLVAPESALHPAPEGPSDAEIAVMHCTFGTAYRDLVVLARLERGERVLITGANGGVGVAAVQIAARLGAEVVAAVRDERHRSFVQGLGASQVVVDSGSSLHKQPAVGRVDLALDTVGAATFNAALRSLRLGGRLVVVGNIQPESVAVNLGYVITHGLSIHGGSGATRADMAALFALHAEAPFQVPIDRELPLSRAEEAHRLVRVGGLRGRIVLVPDPGAVA
jgi:D-arabinose 1-dehydrogenase-like Zn-dependent alcohol dehydrogenase